MNLNDFSHALEYEIRGTHSLGSDTILKLIELVESETPSTQEVSTSLSPFSKSVLATIRDTLSDTNERIRNKIIEKIKSNAFALFPGNECIYLTYALVKIRNDREKFLTKLLEKSIEEITAKKNLCVKLFMYFGTLLLIVGLVVLALRTFRREQSRQLVDLL